MIEKVCKFGGTSLATIEQVDKALDIMMSDEGRKYMVVSAPGARYKGDTKMTDLLLELSEYRWGDERQKYIDRVHNRIQELACGNERLSNGLRTKLIARVNMATGKTLAAFGEYASALLINERARARGISSQVVLPEDIGFVAKQTPNGYVPDPEFYDAMTTSLSKVPGSRLIIFPGFYAHNIQGSLVTLPRGGSDISGAVLARVANAGIYENWTDENGLKRADPRIVPHAQTIPEMTFREARELAYMGFKLQDRCFEPLRNTDLVLHVRNTNNPSHPGTLISETRETGLDETIVGIACQREIESVATEKAYIDDDVGFGRRLLGVYEELSIPYEHGADGVDNVAITTDRKRCGSHTLQTIMDKVKAAVNPDSISSSMFSILGIAGQRLKQGNARIISRTYGALANVTDHIEMQDGNPLKLSFFVGVPSDKAEDAVRAVYEEFFPREA